MFELKGLADVLKYWHQIMSLVLRSKILLKKKDNSVAFYLTIKKVGKEWN